MPADDEEFDVVEDARVPSTEIISGSFKAPSEGNLELYWDK
jgi:hypothetical protein